MQLRGLFLLAALAPALAAEAPAPVVIPKEERVVVQLVQFPFVATDRQGRPITDLTKDEIQVKVRGQEPRVTYLERWAEEDRTPAGPIPDVRLYVDAPGGWSEPIRSSMSSEFLAVVLDNENDSPLRREEARDKIVQFLGTELRPELRIAVFSYNGTLKLELPFTSDRNAAKSAVMLAVSREGRPRVDLRTRMRKLTDQFENCMTPRSNGGSTTDGRCVRDVANEYIGEMRPRSADLILALDGVVQYLGGVRGRKEVLLVSHGFPIDLSPVVMEAARAVLGDTDALSEIQLYLGFGDDPRGKMDRLIESLIRQRITMTFVDRITPPSADTGASVGQARTAGSMPTRAEYDAAVGDMEQIAISSGGLRIQSTDLSEGLSKAMRVHDGAYEVGIQLSSYLSPDKLSRISVDCTRRGVKIYSRRGIYVQPNTSEDTLPGRFAFGKGVPLKGERAPGIRQPFEIQVNPESIGYDVTDAEAHATFTLHLVVTRTADGRHLADTYNFVEHAYDKKMWLAPDRAAMTLPGWVELPPGDYTLEGWVRNVRSGKEGVIRQRVKVPEQIKGS